MKALTLWRPWPTAIFELGKDVENRRWHPPDSLIGKRLAIHAGKKFDPAGVDFIRSLGLECSEDEADHPLGIIGTVRITGSVVDVAPHLSQEMVYSEWFMGPVGWMLSDVQKLTAPLAAVGKQGLWSVPAGLSAYLK